MAAKLIHSLSSAHARDEGTVGKHVKCSAILLFKLHSQLLMQYCTGDKQKWLVRCLLFAFILDTTETVYLSLYVGDDNI